MPIFSKQASSQTSKLYLQFLKAVSEKRNTVGNDVAMPGYNPADSGSGIVHIGIGNFHRAHQAVYVDEILRRGGGDWRITAVSLRSPDMRDRLQSQNGLYTLCERNGDAGKLRVVGAVAKVLVAPENPAAVIEALAAESTHVVTATVTEKGYCLKPGSRALDLSHPDIEHDILHPGTPKTLHGFVLAACRLRRARGLAGFNLLSCDNLPDNGALLRDCLLTAARLQDSGLARWMEQHIGFCSTMVDCMVPATSESIAEGIQRRAGYRDTACLLSESFRQWVIEDNFVAPSPDWRSVGVSVVADVAPYERMKLRLLNGSHSALAFLGALFGYSYIYEAAADPLLRKFVLALMQREILPTLQPLPDVDLRQYCDTLIARFSNPSVPYTCQQVASDSSQKLPQRILEPALEGIEGGWEIPLLSAVVAAWIACIYRGSFGQQCFPPNDPGARQLVDMLKRQKEQEDFPTRDHVTALLTHAGIVFPRLLKSEKFTDAVHTALERFIAGGRRTLLKEILGRSR
ncbi:mannitol dehydrogenase family protein [Microbulbifer sp. YPW1]|uniref:mannitol dehydrogenase family protein n=1 Tax=Microbulbifer sp. YPW1 TaxID=2745199 RepID=UPI00159B5D68|nr:mannitol dehydrogenase family protein [Microbulbifer sp. YPW1]QKX16997.1 mannitol dehydrogenase family protein [Microbulbifer sp. YPW1]